MKRSHKEGQRQEIQVGVDKDPLHFVNSVLSLRTLQGTKALSEGRRGPALLQGPEGSPRLQRNPRPHGAQGGRASQADRHRCSGLPHSLLPARPAASPKLLQRVDEGPACGSRTAAAPARSCRRTR